MLKHKLKGRYGQMTLSRGRRRERYLIKGLNLMKQGRVALRTSITAGDELAGVNHLTAPSSTANHIYFSAITSHQLPPFYNCSYRFLLFFCSCPRAHTCLIDFWLPLVNFDESIFLKSSNSHFGWHLSKLQTQTI